MSTADEIDRFGSTFSHTAPSSHDKVLPPASRSLWSRTSTRLIASKASRTPSDFTVLSMLARRLVNQLSRASRNSRQTRSQADSSASAELPALLKQLSSLDFGHAAELPTGCS